MLNVPQNPGTRPTQTDSEEVRKSYGLLPNRFERAVKRIVRKLGETGILLRKRSGRRNGYTVAGTCPLRRPLEARRSGQDLLAARGG